MFLGIFQHNLSKVVAFRSDLYLGLQTFAKDKVHTHMKIMGDNTTAVNIINNMGTSHSDSCNSIAKEIWE